jgi:hypothetical protein
MEEEKHTEKRATDYADYADDTEDKEDHTKTQRTQSEGQQDFFFVRLVALCENPKRGWYREELTQRRKGAKKKREEKSGGEAPRPLKKRADVIPPCEKKICISALRCFASLRLGVNSVLTEQEKKSELRITRITRMIQRTKRITPRHKEHNPKGNKISSL